MVMISVLKLRGGKRAQYNRNPTFRDGNYERINSMKDMQSLSVKRRSEPKSNILFIFALSSAKY